jgi:SET domain-containing protein
MSDLKKAILDHLAQEVFCRLGASALHGVGVFAIRSISKGSNPLQSRLKHREIKFSHDELKGLPPGVRKQIEMFCYYDESGVMISTMGMNTMDFSIYLNHSKKPNLRMQKDGSFEALRRIKIGEELTMDYDHSFDAEHYFD